MAGRGECAALALLGSDENVGARTHAAADQHRLAIRAQLFRQARMPRPEGTRRPLAVDVELARLTLDEVCLDLACVVRNIEQEWQVSMREEARKHLSRQVANDLPVG